MFKTLSVLMALLALYGCVTITPISKDTVDSRYSSQTVTWKKGGSTYILFKSYEYEGYLAICGAALHTLAETDNGLMIKDLAREKFLRQSRLASGDTIVTSGLSFLTAYSTDHNYKYKAMKSYMTGKTANCVKTDVEWDRKFRTRKLKLKSPSRVRVLI